MTTESVASDAVTINFDHSRCIHSRFCVLGRPDVFVPNVVGPWIHPEVASGEEVAEVAHACPSGAITYVRRDGPQERPPKVNLVRLRENGPLAFHGELTIAGQTTPPRATLCRCGASKNKPFCDGSHTEAGFSATGEPATGDTTALAVRNGPVDVSPSPNGPLLVTGNVEVVSGTGRTIRKATKLALCRCGQSSNKPYCDGTHAKVGFSAP